MNHFVKVPPCNISIVAMSHVNGEEHLSRNFIPDDCLCEYEASDLDYAGTFESNLKKITFFYQEDQKQVKGTLEVKGLDSNREINKRKLPEFKRGDHLMLDGFLNCDVWLDVHNWGWNTAFPVGKSPFEHRTFLTRCLLNLEIL